jgi:ABC-2 type transport system ATP-binding protein
MAAIEVRALRRIFEPPRHRRKDPTVVALDGIDLDIPSGEVHGLLGPNGAGKTTLVKVLSTVLLPTSGTARVLGHDVVSATAAVRPLISIVFGGERGLYWRLTARQNLEYFAALYQVPEPEVTPRSDELLARVGLGDRADARVETYSRGMRQRLHLARGLISNPRVMFLDEPTVGLDPVAARDFRTMIDEIRGEGRTILLTTHDMREAEEVCDRVTLIDHGRIIATETPRTLGGLISQFERVDAEGVPPELVADIAALPGVSAITPLGDGSVRIEVTSREATRPVLEHLVAAGVTNVRTSLPDLEEVYVHLIGDRGLEL